MECARRRGGTFAVIRVRCHDAAPAQDVLPLVARLSDVVGEYGPGEYEVLLVDAAPDDAAAAVRRFKDALGRKDREGNSYLAFFFQPRTA